MCSYTDITTSYETNSSMQNTYTVTSAKVAAAILFAQLSYGLPLNINVFDVPQLQNAVVKQSSIKSDISEVDLFLKNYPEISVFLEKLNPLIQQVYGQINVSRSLWKHPITGSDAHIVITIFSGLDNNDAIAESENKLFDLIEENNMVAVLEHVVISQEWIDV